MRHSSIEKGLKIHCERLFNVVLTKHELQWCMAISKESSKRE
jgi:hypothetical protein